MGATRQAAEVAQSEQLDKLRRLRTRSNSTSCGGCALGATRQAAEVAQSEQLDKLPDTSNYPSTMDGLDIHFFGRPSIHKYPRPPSPWTWISIHGWTSTVDGRNPRNPRGAEGAEKKNIAIFDSFCWYFFIFFEFEMLSETNLLQNIFKQRNKKKSDSLNIFFVNKMDEEEVQIIEVVDDQRPGDRRQREEDEVPVRGWDFSLFLKKVVDPNSTTNPKTIKCVCMICFPAVAAAAAVAAGAATLATTTEAVTGSILSLGGIIIYY